MLIYSAAYKVGLGCYHTQIPLDKVVIDIGKREFSSGLIFVACSRVCHITDLLFVPPFTFQGVAILTKSNRLKERLQEDARLKQVCNTSPDGNIAQVPSEETSDVPPPEEVVKGDEPGVQALPFTHEEAVEGDKLKVRVSLLHMRKQWRVMNQGCRLSLLYHMSVISSIIQWIMSGRE